jgi:hypothetical protein
MNSLSRIIIEQLDPNNGSVMLDTLTRAAKAVGRQLRMELV